MKILNKTTRLRRKIRQKREKLIDWINQLKEKQKAENLVKFLRKRYVLSGSHTIKLSKYSFGYDYEPYLQQLAQQGNIIYMESEASYIITIKDDG